MIHIYATNSYKCKPTFFFFCQNLSSYDLRQSQLYRMTWNKQFVAFSNICMSGSNICIISRGFLSNWHSINSCRSLMHISTLWVWVILNRRYNKNILHILYAARRYFLFQLKSVRMSNIKCPLIIKHYLYSACHKYRCYYFSNKNKRRQLSVCNWNRRSNLTLFTFYRNYNLKTIVIVCRLFLNFLCFTLCT